VTDRPQPPPPADDPSPDSVELVDPQTGKRVPAADMRERFARRSVAAGRDRDAERAFVQSKIEMIRTHPTLSEAEKAAAIDELSERLGENAEPTELREGRED
jgi:hypothetical protein